jgi:hypothetical protein
MGFWGSFWRETGKNTGKWASNKVFGKGCSTPYSHDVNINQSNESHSGNRGSNEISNTDDILNEMHRNDAVYSERSIDILDQNFSDNPKELFEQVSDLISQLNITAVGINSSSTKNALIARAKHGIILMETLGMHEAAQAFKSELRTYRFRQYGRFVFGFLFLIFLLGMLFILSTQF